MIEKLWAKWLCWKNGHPRGKRIMMDGSPDGVVLTFECPRCKATWQRTLKKGPKQKPLGLAA